MAVDPPALFRQVANNSHGKGWPVVLTAPRIAVMADSSRNLALRAPRFDDQGLRRPPLGARRWSSAPGMRSAPGRSPAATGLRPGVSLSGEVRIPSTSVTKCSRAKNAVGGASIGGTAGEQNTTGEDNRAPMTGDNSLGLLGGFVFSVGGDALLGISSSSQRLIAFLAVRNRATTRDHVAGTLWPASSDERAGGSLRSAVARLDGPIRQALTVTGGDLTLADGVAVDVHRAQALAHRLIDRDAPKSETDIDGHAVSCLSDDLLPGWYDDWAIIAGEDWHQLRMHALEAVAARLTDADRLAEATVAALAAVHAEPLRESARAALIRVYMAEGNQSNAHGEFERYRVLLRAELDVAPTSRLRLLLVT